MADDQLLARARLLVGMAAGVQAAVSSVNLPRVEVDEAAPSSSSITGGLSPSSPTALMMSPSSPRRKQTASGDAGGMKFKVSVITGSSLVSVLSAGDIRNHLKRGATVDIEGKTYALSTKIGSEWSSTRIELASDYDGESNLNACLNLKATARRSPKKKNVAEPIPSSDIRSAIAGLETIHSTFQQHNDSSDNRPIRKANSTKNMNVVEYKKPMQEYNSKKSDAGSSIPKLNYTEITPSSGSISSSKGMITNDKNKNSFSNLGDNQAGIDNVAYNFAGAYSSNRKMHNSEEQRKRATLRVAQRKKEDLKLIEEKKKQEEIQKNAHHDAMERKTNQLRGITLKRVAKLKANKLEMEEQKKQMEVDELQKKTERASAAQSETTRQKMLQMRKETKNRLRQAQMQEKERLDAEKMDATKKLSAIADSRRRLDVNPPRGYIPPVHTQQIIRRTRTASPKNGNSSRMNKTSPIQESSQDDYAINTSNLSPQHHRISSPVTVTESNNAADVPIQIASNSYPKRIFEEDDISDDSLGGDEFPDIQDPPAMTLQQHLSPSRVANCDEDISVITFDSPERKQKTRNMVNSKLPVKRKPWKPLKPIPIREYIEVPN